MMRWWWLPLLVMLVISAVFLALTTANVKRPPRRITLYEMCVADGHRPYDCYAKVYGRRY